jgi:phosphatidylglycerophosphate synthase
VERTGLGGLLGLRRGGDAPPATRAGQPLRPFTLPNLVGYARIGLITVFLVIALGSEDGRVTLATVCWLVAAASDYLDGLIARATGQYSRLGALMDPAVDRALILSGVIVDWKFELLPRWGLGLLAARELAMLVLVAIGLRKGLDVEINWVGRLAVAPVMAGVGGVLIADFWLAKAFFYIGLAGGLLATAIYLRDGLQRLRDTPRPI